MEIQEFISKLFCEFRPYLNERQVRIFTAICVKTYGFGGSTIISNVTGIARTTISRGLKEIEVNIDTNSKFDKVREKGGGRKKITYTDPSILKDLDQLVEPHFRGDPESPLRWTSLSTRKLSVALKEKGHNISPVKVGQLLEELDYSLQGARKTLEGKSHPDRDSQFRYINFLIQIFQENNQPVISIDCKKKEIIGNYKNNGKTWRKKGEPIKVKSHDFKDAESGIAIPFGIYDITHLEGWVNVGIDHETSAFAAESIRRWWNDMGKQRYPNASSILITADGGGSNGHRRRAWKTELQKLSSDIGLVISMSHFPPGTSKWNKIEHMLFAQITKNWEGEILIDLKTIVNLIGNTKTKTGLKVKCVLDDKKYPLGVKITDKELNNLLINHSIFHKDWNYVISPNTKFL